MVQATLDKEQSLLIITPSNTLREEDFQQITSLVDPYIEANGCLDGILIHADNFSGWDGFSSMLAHARFVKNHHKDVAKVAVVADNRFLEYAQKVAEHFVQAELKHFPEDQHVQAMAWLKADDSEFVQAAVCVTDVATFAEWGLA